MKRILKFFFFLPGFISFGVRMAWAFSVMPLAIFDIQVEAKMHYLPQIFGKRLNIDDKNGENH